MSAVFWESIIAYIATNIDDIFILIFLYAGASERSALGKIMLGKYIGIYVILGISFLATLGLSLIPEEYIHFLGIIPILLGIKAYWDEKKQDSSDNAEKGVRTSFILSAAIITIANSADNIGVYVPLFARYTLPQMLVTTVVFAVMTFLWCVLGEKIASLPPIQNAIQKYKHIATPIVYIFLGIYILVF